MEVPTQLIFLGQTSDFTISAIVIYPGFGKLLLYYILKIQDSSQTRSDHVVCTENDHWS